MKRLLQCLTVACLLATSARAEPPEIFWSLLGGEASADGWTTIFAEDATDRPKPREDFARVVSVAHQAIGNDRQLLRFRFDRPLSPMGQSLQVYLDSDLDEATGRQDGFEGTDHQVGLEAADGRHTWVDFRYEFDGFRRPGDLAWAGTIGDDAYVVLDAPIAKQGDTSAVRLSWATQFKDTRGQSLGAEREAFATYELSPTPAGAAPETVALPYELTTAADQAATSPQIDGTRLYDWPRDGTTAMIARLNWIGPIVVEYDGGETAPTLANRLHRVALPAGVRSARVRALTTDLEWVTSPVVSLDATTPTVQATGEFTPTTILATNPTDAPLVAYPQRLGVPVAQGVLAEADELKVQDDAGKPVDAEFDVMSRWSDGTVRFASCDFLADLPANGERTFTVTNDGVDTRGGVRVDEADDEVKVDTGRLSFALSREPFLALRDVRVDGREFGDLDLRGVVTGVDGDTFTTDGGLRKLTIDDADGLVATVTAAGEHVSEQGGELLAWQMRFRVWAGSPLLEVQHVFGVSDTTSESTTFGSLVLEIGLAGDVEQASVWQPDDRQHELRQGDKVRVRTGGHDGVFDLGGGASVAVRDFWQNYPKRAEYRDDRLFLGLAPELPEGLYDDKPQDLVTRLFLSMRNGVYEYMQGFQRRHTLLFDFGGNATPSVDTLARAAPDAYAATAAIGPLLNERDFPDRYADYGDFTRACLGRYVADRRERRAYGLMNYGDWFGERRYAWGNNEYDTVLGLLSHYAMLGDAGLLREGSLMAEHLVDVDVRHHARDPRQIGSTYIHLVGHTGGYFGRDWRRLQATVTPGAFAAVDIQNWGHYWGEGLMLHGLMRGDERTLATLENVANRVATTYVNKPIGEWRNPRQQGWTLKVPIAAYKVTGDPFHLLAAETIVDALLGRQDTTGGWSVELRDTAASPGGMSYGSTNFPIGIVLSSLARYHEITGDDRVADAIVRGARWLIEDLWEINSPIGFRYSSAAGSQGGSNFYHIAYAVAYAHQLEPDRTFADALVAYSDAYLSEPIGDTHEFGKPWSQRMREVAPTLPILADVLDTQHTGLPADNGYQWIIRLPADDGDRSPLRNNLRILGRGQGDVSATVRVRTLKGETLLERRVGGAGSVDVSDLPAGQLLELVLQPLGGETWDAQLVRGGQMLSLASGPAVGAGGVEARLRIEVPPGVDRFTVTARPAGSASATVDVLDPNGDLVATVAADGKTVEIDATPPWPALAGASYRGPLNDSDLQYSLVVRDGPAFVKVGGVPPYAAASKTSFFRTSLPQIAIAGDTVLDVGDGPLALDASASTSLNGGDLTFRWMLGDGTTIDGPRVDGHTYAEAGSYAATLVATGADGSTATLVFPIRQSPPSLLGDSPRAFVNAGDFVSQSLGGVLATPRINSIGDMITYWQGDAMNKLAYRFTIDEPGQYVLTTKFANNSKEPTARAYWLDGEQADPSMNNVAFPVTGGWSRFSDNWAWLTLARGDGSPIVFDLAAGEHTLEVGNTAGGLGVDYFVFHRPADLHDSAEEAHDDPN